MKVLFYNHTGKVSGAERMMLMILSQMNSARIKTEVLCPAAGPLTAMLKEAGFDPIPVSGLEAKFTRNLSGLWRGALSIFKSARRLRKMVKQSAPDLVQANSTRAGITMTLATIGMKVPVVWHVQDLMPHHPVTSLIRLLAALSLRTHPLAISEAVARNFAGRVWRARQPIKVIHNAIDLQRFQAAPEQANNLRQIFELSAETPVIGIVGSLERRKGQLELIKAFAEVLKVIPSAVLLIVGEAMFEPNYLRQLQDAVLSAGISSQVRFLGAREDVPVLMQALDLLVVNSRAEGFGLVVIEAMASGTPVLATAVDGIPEIIRHGETGWLVEPGDQQALAAAIISLLPDPDRRRVVANQAQTEAWSRFQAEKYLLLLKEFYASLPLTTTHTQVARERRGLPNES